MELEAVVAVGVWRFMTSSCTFLFREQVLMYPAICAGYTLALYVLVTDSNCLKLLGTCIVCFKRLGTIRACGRVTLSYVLHMKYFE